MRREQSALFARSARRAPRSGRCHEAKPSPERLKTVPRAHDSAPHRRQLRLIGGVEECSSRRACCARARERRARSRAARRERDLAQTDVDLFRDVRDATLRLDARRSSTPRIDDETEIADEKENRSRSSRGADLLEVARDARGVRRRRHGARVRFGRGRGRGDGGAAPFTVRRPARRAELDEREDGLGERRGGARDASTAKRTFSTPKRPPRKGLFPVARAHRGQGGAVMMVK